MSEQRRSKYKHIKRIRIFDNVTIYDINVEQMKGLPKGKNDVPTFDDHIANPMFVQKIGDVYFLSFAIDYDGFFKPISKHQFLSIINKRTMKYDGIVSRRIPHNNEDLYEDSS